MGAKTQINVILKGKNADILIFFAAKMHGTTPTTGISDIEAAQQDGKVVIYNLNGMKVQAKTCR